MRATICGLAQARDAVDRRKRRRSGYSDDDDDDDDDGSSDESSSSGESSSASGSSGSDSSPPETVDVDALEWSAFTTGPGAAGAAGPLLAGWLRDEQGDYVMAFTGFLGAMVIVFFALVFATPPQKPPAQQDGD